jgi:hypothetical protein
MASSNERASAQRITGRSFTSMDPERQREIVVESPDEGTLQERRSHALRNSRPPHLAWMAPEADVSEAGNSRRR